MKLKRVAAVAMSGLMILNVLNPDTLAFQGSIKVLSEDGNIKSQTNSLPERVFPNEYSIDSRTQNFDNNWRFTMGDIAGAESKNFNDSKWRELNLPHDYSIEQEFSSKMEAESGYLPGGTAWYRKKFTLPVEAASKDVRIDFDGIYMNATVYINGHKLGMHHYGYTPFSFDITKYLDFSGENVIAVKVDHKTPSSRWYSGSGIYRSVNLSISNKLHIDLWGIKVDTPDLKNNTTNPKVRIKSNIRNTSNESKNFVVVNTIYNGETEVTSITSEQIEVSANANTEIISEASVNNPDLWSISNPKLYKVRTDIKVGDDIVDTYYTDFGFRYFDFNKNTGFSLNGQNMKLKGVCMHHDQGALGAVANEAAIRRQVEILKDMGCNSIRVTHNPAAKTLLDICDELGVLVIDEAFDGWHKKKNGNINDYSSHFEKSIEVDNEILGASSNMKWYEFDLAAMINSAYNSPSVIMWSLGNEILEGVTDGSNGYEELSVDLARLGNSLDATRPVTIGDNRLKSQGNTNNIYARIDQNVANAGGVVGLNYANGSQYDFWHNLKPDWPLYASETVSSINSRGIYKINGYTGNQNVSKQLTAYDKSKVGWGAMASEGWYEIIKRDYLAGEYVWTGFDYIGEPTPYNGTGGGAIGSWPSPKNSYFGIIDTAGFPKDSYYLYRSLWNENNTTLHILPAWNENVVEKDRENKVPVVVYSNAKSVRLLFTPINGEERDLGLRAFTEENTGLYKYQIYKGEGKSNIEYENLYLTWKVPYEAGTLRAVAYSDNAGTQVIGETTGRNIVKTTGEAKKIVLKQYKAEDDLLADGKDLAYIEVDVVDNEGNIIPDASNDITFEISGEGSLVGLDNGNPIDHTSYKANHRRVFSGKALAIVQTSENEGKITINASSDGLTSASLTLNSEKVEHDNSEGEVRVKNYYMSKNYYVKKGYYPILPEKITVAYTNDKELEESIAWESITEEQINKVGSFEVKGKLANGKEVFVNINIIDKVAALLNYSTTTPIGVKAILPESRPAVLENGEILKVDFPVIWEDIDENSYSNAGIIKVSGKAEVLGEKINVEASIRVQNETIRLGDSISNQALRVTQEIGGANPSDTLDAIKDGSIASYANSSGGANPYIWSNWNAAQAGTTEAELTLEYATQQRLGQVVIYFAKDGGSLRYPDANTTRLYVSEDGTNWTELVTEENIGEDEISENVKAYTYNFNPTTFTFIKAVVKNSTVNTGTRWKASIGITEIELRPASGSYTTNKTAKLEKVELNGEIYNEADISKGSIGTPALFIDSIDIKAKDNAAYTLILDKEDSNKAYIIVESEDHQTRKTIDINLNVDEKAENAEDATRDYNYENVNIDVGNQQANEPGSRANDNNEATLWHTNWYGVTPVGNRWISLELDEEQVVDGLRYLARTGQSNGRVEEYKIFTSLDGNTWKEVAKGTWENESGWKLAGFEPTLAKFIKLQGIHTYGEGAQRDKFMSASEVRVRLAKDTINISDASFNIRAELEKDKYIVDELKAPIKAKAIVTKEGGELKYGIDYRVKYENNNKIGKAYAIVEGILKYSGKIRLPFSILSKSARKVFVENANIVSINGENVLSQGGDFEKGTDLTLRAEEKEGKDFAYWRAVPNGLEFEDITNPEISFKMPEYSVRLIAVYTKNNMVENDIYTNPTPDTWYASANREDMEDILNTIKVEGENTALRLDLSKQDRNLYKATDSEAVEEIEDMETGFYVSGKLVKEIVENNAWVEKDIEDTKTLRVSIEVPKKDRNMADYKVVAYKKTDNKVSAYIVDAMEKDGFISFMLSTDTVYGVYYNKTYEIVFEDYDGSEISRQYVKLAEMPEIPTVEERRGYTFVGWDKEIDVAKTNKRYKAVYKVSNEQIENSKTRLESEISRIRQQLAENSYTTESLRAIERELARAEVLIEDSDSVVKIENQISKLRETFLSLTNTDNRNRSTGGGSGSFGIVSLRNLNRASEKTYVKISGKWIKVNNTWRMEQNGGFIKDKWAYLDSNNIKSWYLFDTNGDMRTSWANINGKWYYLNPEKTQNEGLMLTGWRWIKSKDGKERCYYLNNDGSLAINTTIDGKYVVNNNGVWTIDGVEQLR